MKDQDKLLKKWRHDVDEGPELHCGRLDMHSYDAITGAPVRYVYVESLTGEERVEITGPFCDHIAFRAADYQPRIEALQARIAELEAQLEQPDAVTIPATHHIDTSVDSRIGGVISRERDRMAQPDDDLELDGCSRDDMWDHLTPAEAYGQGWSDGHETALSTQPAAVTDEQMEKIQVICVKWFFEGGSKDSRNSRIRAALQEGE